MASFAPRKPALFALTSLAAASLLALACSDASEAPPDTSASSSGSTSSSSGSTSSSSTSSSTSSSSGGTTDAGTAAGPKHVYVMTTYRLWAFDTAAPSTHTEVALGFVGNPAGSYGNLGIYEPFDVSPDGKTAAILKDGALRIAPLSNVTAEVTVPVDSWAAAPRFTDDGQKVRWIRRSRSGGGRFDDVSVVEVPIAGGAPTVAKALPDATFRTDLDRYVWKWDGSGIVGPARLEGRPDTTAKAHGVVTIDLASGTPTMHTKSYGASYFSFAQNTQEPGCVGAVCVTVHDGTTGENNGSFTSESAGFLPDGRVYFTSNRDQYVKGGAPGGARKYLADTFVGGDYETLAEHTGPRPVAYTRDGAFYATLEGSGPAATVVVKAASGATVATLTGFNQANLPTSVRFGP